MQCTSARNKKKNKVHSWPLWFTKDLVPSFPKVHGWYLWFALCNAFSPQPTILKVLACPSHGLNALQSTNHRDHPCTFGKLGTKSKILVNHMDHSCTLL
ncbi:hypothetical protein Hanom_Chr06g00569931 [Helianthus anomalus]